MNIERRKCDTEVKKVPSYKRRLILGKSLSSGVAFVLFGFVFPGLWGGVVEGCEVWQYHAPCGSSSLVVVAMLVCSRLLSLLPLRLRCLVHALGCVVHF